MKKLRIIRSKPPTEAFLLSIIEKRVSEIRKKMELLSEKLGDNGQRCVFKYMVPKTKNGQTIANIGNDIQHIGCCENSILHGTNTAPISVKTHKHKTKLNKL